MKPLFIASWQHIKHSFSVVTFSLCIVTICIACWLNYGEVFRLWPVDSSFNNSFLFLVVLFLVFFGLGFLFSTLPQKIKPDLRNRYLWVLLTAPILFALKVALPFDAWFFQNASQEWQNAFYKVAAWMGGLLLIIPSLLLMHLFFEKKLGLYFTKKVNTYQFYLFLLFCMIPLLVVATMQPVFQQTYPRAKDITDALDSSATILHYSLFEFFYILDFITVELFFRGMLIAVITRIMGVQGIIPAALFYFSIHLGKPMPEAIGSFFGGLILGAVSYETKSIWGGWMVHCGIALLMELFAFLF